jgi:hypothetical protein
LEGKYIHQVIGVLLYYSRAVDFIILVGLNSLAAAQSKPTAHTLSLVKWLLDSTATNPDAILTNKKCNMVLAVHSNASYLSKPLGGRLSNSKICPGNRICLANKKCVLEKFRRTAAEQQNICPVLVTNADTSS